MFVAWLNILGTNQTRKMSVHQWRVARSMTIRQTSRKSLAGFPVESLEKAKKEAKQMFS